MNIESINALNVGLNMAVEDLNAFDQRLAAMQKSVESSRDDCVAEIEKMNNELIKRTNEFVDSIQRQRDAIGRLIGVITSIADPNFTP